MVPSSSQYLFTGCNVCLQGSCKRVRIRKASRQQSIDTRKQRCWHYQTTRGLFRGKHVPVHTTSNSDHPIPHSSAFSFTPASIPLSAAIDGVKKYSPPLGITNGLTAFSLTALFASCGNKPVTSTCSFLLSCPNTASKPTPGLTKFLSFAHCPWMKAKPLLRLLW